MSLSTFSRALALIGLTALGGCQYLPAMPKVDWSADRFLGVVTPYKVEVVQGNFVSKEQVEQLKPGMSRQQVRELLGTSLLTDVFHANRWDYVFTIRRQGTDQQAAQTSQPTPAQTSPTTYSVFSTAYSRSSAGLSPWWKRSKNRSSTML